MYRAWPWKANINRRYWRLRVLGTRVGKEGLSQRNIASFSLLLGQRWKEALSIRQGGCHREWPARTLNVHQRLVCFLSHMSVTEGPWASDERGGIVVFQILPSVEPGLFGLKGSEIQLNLCNQHTNNVTCSLWLKCNLTSFSPFKLYSIEDDGIILSWSGPVLQGCCWNEIVCCPGYLLIYC